MSALRTPDSILAELVSVRESITRGIEAHRDAEEAYIEAKFAAERSELTTFVEAGGTIADRQAVAKLRSEDARKAADVAKAKLSYIRAHLDALRDSQMNLQSQAKLVEAMYRTAGLGER